MSAKLLHRQIVCSKKTLLLLLTQWESCQSSGMFNSRSVTTTEACEMETVRNWTSKYVSALLKEFFEDFTDAIGEHLAFLYDGVEFDEGDYLFQISDPLTEFKRETLNAHNNYRTVHGCPPLELSDDLTSTAQAWADKLADRGYVQYSENPGLGENICVLDMDASRKAGEQLVREWYREIDHYNYNNPGWKREAYRVSQLLWKSTSEIGIGFAKIPGQNKAVVVVNYRPAGNNNMPGEFERNVLPPHKTDNLNRRRT